MKYSRTETQPRGNLRETALDVPEVECTQILKEFEALGFYDRRPWSLPDRVVPLGGKVLRGPSMDGWTWLMEAREEVDGPIDYYLVYQHATDDMAFHRFCNRLLETAGVGHRPPSSRPEGD